MHKSHLVVPRDIWLLVVLVAGTMLVGVITATAQGPVPQSPQAAFGTGFTYQGQLKNGSSAINGNCDLAFRLYDAATSGNLVGSPLTQTVPITNGLFTRQLDFGASAFNGNARWLDLLVRCPSGSGSYTVLNPRQQLTATPYSLFSAAPWVTSGSDISYSSGKVGVGNNTPLGKLQLTTANDTSPSIVTVWDTRHFVVGSAGNSGGIGMSYDQASNVGYIEALSPNVAWRNLILQAGGGNVGIGTTTPGARLQVRGSDTSRYTNAFAVEDSNGVGALKVYDNLDIETGGGLYVGTLIGPPSLSHVCIAYGTYGYLMPCSSAAEYVPTIDSGPGFPETADLVSLAPAVANPYGDAHAPFVVQKSAAPCDSNLLGFIVNPESGADGKKLNEHYLPLAIYGYFPAKVTAENGVIKRGDPITSSSKPGYGMKATQACKIIGYALADASAEGTIQVFANHGENSAPEVMALRTQVKSQAEQIAVQQKQLDALSTRLDALELAAKLAGAPTLATR